MRNLIFFVIGASIFAIGESLQCYNCVEGEIIGFSECVKPFSKNDRNAKCLTDGFCMKDITIEGERTVIIRQCLPFYQISGFNPYPIPAIGESIETELGNFKSTAHFCEKDLCNTATIPTTTTSFVILLLTILFLMNCTFWKI